MRFCSGVLPLKISYGWKILLGLVIVLAGLKYSIYTSGGGTWLSPSVSKEVMLVMEVAYGAFGGAGFSSYSERHRFHWIVPVEEMGRKPFYSHLIKILFFFTLMGIALFSGLYGCWQAIKVPDVREQTITIKKSSCSMERLEGCPTKRSSYRSCPEPRLACPGLFEKLML